MQYNYCHNYVLCTIVLFITRIILYIYSYYSYISAYRVVTQESNRLECAPRPPIALTNAVSWRVEGIKHRKNEIFLDVIEKLNILVASNGTVLHSEIMVSVDVHGLVVEYYLLYNVCIYIFTVDLLYIYIHHMHVVVGY